MASITEAATFTQSGVRQSSVELPIGGGLSCDIKTDTSVIDKRIEVALRRATASISAFSKEVARDQMVRWCLVRCNR